MEGLLSTGSTPSSFTNIWGIFDFHCVTIHYKTVYVFLPKGLALQIICPEKNIFIVDLWLYGTLLITDSIYILTFLFAH